MNEETRSEYASTGEPSMGSDQAETNALSADRGLQRRYISAEAVPMREWHHDPIEDATGTPIKPSTSQEGLAQMGESANNNKKATATKNGKDKSGSQNEGVFIAPENFAMVVPGVYRSGFPKMKNFPFLRRIGLKSILTLVLEEYPEANRKFNEQCDIKLFQFGVPGNKEPFVDIPENIIRLAVEQLLDVRNHPVLIHCNKGKHRTGCLVGCLRKACGWSLCSILDEYIRFSYPKSRFMDQQFIELFDVNRIRLKRKYVPKWLPSILEVSGPGAQTVRNDEKPQENENKKQLNRINYL